MAQPKRQESKLNRMNTSSKIAKVGTKIDQLITLVNELRAGIVVLTAQLDADAGVTDTDYAANVDPTAPAVDVLT